MSDFSRLIDHLRARALHTDGPFTLRSGEVSSWYLDARQTTFDGQGARLVGEAILELLEGRVEAVGGLTMGADPVAVATAMVAAERGRSLRAFSVRKAPKDHGLSGRLVGPVRPGDHVAVVEDTTTTGGALMEVIRVARSEGLVIVQAVALCDRSGGAVGERLAREGIPFRSTLVPSDLGVE